MAMATSSFSSYDRSVPIISDDSVLSSPHHRFPTKDSTSEPSHLRQHFDDTDLPTVKRQHASNSGREEQNLSTSVDDLSQLNDHMPYRNSTLVNDFNDPDDEEIHFNDGSSFDYELAIQERVKRANEVFEHDNTPAELTHQQRVSFDSVVKAVDIVQDPEDENTTKSPAKQPISPVIEEPFMNSTGSQNEINPHEYTVPLNDTQPKVTPTLVEQIKAMQFYNGAPIGDRRFTSNANTTHSSANCEDNSSSSSSSKLNETSDSKSTSTVTIESSRKPLQSSVLVAKNGIFELQNEDDYTAKRSINDSQSDNDDNSKSVTKTTRITSTETKSRSNLQKSDASHRPDRLLTRPKSSDNGIRADKKFNDPMSKSLPSNKSKSTTNNQQRAKSATVSKSIESFIIKPASVDFDELNRKAAERKRTELQEERRKREEAEAKHKDDLIKAKESYEKWLHDKDIERRRLNEEKRMEREEEETRQVKCEQELGELREKKYKEWIDRKNREISIANEFKKLQARDESMTSGGSSSSIQNSQQQDDHRAFRRWLRQKAEQSKEERRRLRLETRRLRRQQRRSLKRYQLQQDLQLARSFGYT